MSYKFVTDSQQMCIMLIITRKFSLIFKEKKYKFSLIIKEKKYKFSGFPA